MQFIKLTQVKEPAANFKTFQKWTGRNTNRLCVYKIMNLESNSTRLRESEDVVTTQNRRGLTQSRNP